VSRYQKGKTNLDFTEARGSGISWAICKSASRSRQITMPAPHHVFYRLDALPATQPTALKEIYCKVSYKYTAECKTKLLRNNNTTVNMYFGFSSYSTHTLVTVHFTPQRKQSATSHAVHFNVSETFTNKKKQKYYLKVIKYKLSLTQMYLHELVKLVHLHVHYFLWSTA